MFGYINVDKQLVDGAKGLNQTFMCGLCVSTKRLLGNKARLLVNNDINFYNVLLHSYSNVDVVVNHSRCLAHPLRKRTIIDTTSITDKLSIANMILTYYNMYDDIVDGTASFKKKLAVRAFWNQYKKAASLWKDMDDLVVGSYNQLRQLEKDNCGNIDMVCDKFATLSANVAKLVVGDCSQALYNLCYNVGKWIYLIDALDDIKQDFSQGSYNVLIAGYSATNQQELFSNIEEIKFVLYTTLNSVAMYYNDLALDKYKCILDSVIFKYIRNRTEDVLSKYII